MSAANFAACLDFMLSHEGGYVNDPRDPGGETNMGISRRAYPTEDIRNMTRARAGAIYRRDYWDAVQGDMLPPGLDLVAFDAAVNSGVSRGAKWLQRAVGAGVDGIVGPATLAAAEAADGAQTIALATDARLRFLQGLRTWRTFGKGWARRVADVKKTATAMLKQPPPIQPGKVELTEAQAEAVLRFADWQKAAPGDVSAFLKWLGGMPV